LGAFFIAALGFGASSNALAARHRPQGLGNIQHLIFIVQENRSFDHYFGTFPGADGFPSPMPCLPSNWYPSQCFTPYPTHADNQLGGPYASPPQLLDIDNGLMDGFLKQRERQLTGKCGHNGRYDPRATYVEDDEEVGPQVKRCTIDVLAYHDGTDLPNYWAYASNYVLLDHFFEAVHADSHPSHLMLFSSWAAKCPQLNPPDVDSCYTDPIPGQIWGVKYPTPYLWTDITYLLYQNNIPWLVYLDGTIGNGPGNVKVIWDVPQGFQTVQQDGQLANAGPQISQFYSDAANGTLPAVSWILPNYLQSEHPQASVEAGQEYVTGLVNAVMSGPDWNSSAIFVTWDDMGGFYDHEPPPFNFDALGLGIREPSIMISPWAIAGKIDHQVCSTDCYIKLIEDVFLNGETMSEAGRPDPRPDYRDTVAGLGDLTLDFNFSQPPRPPLVLSTHPMTMLRKQ
jgi:phospholipase C